LARLDCTYVSLPDCSGAVVVDVVAAADVLVVVVVVVVDSGGAMVGCASTLRVACTRPAPPRGIPLDRPPPVAFGGSPIGGRGLTVAPDGSAVMTVVDSRENSAGARDSVLPTASSAAGEIASLVDSCCGVRLCWERSKGEERRTWSSAFKYSNVVLCRGRTYALLLLSILSSGRVC